MHFQTLLIHVTAVQYYPWKSWERSETEMFASANTLICQLLMGRMQRPLPPIMQKQKLSRCKIPAETCKPYRCIPVYNALTLSPRKTEIPACRSLIYYRKGKISAWKFWERKLLQITLCLGAPGLGIPCWDERVKRLMRRCGRLLHRRTVASEHSPPTLRQCHLLAQKTASTSWMTATEMLMLTRSSRQCLPHAATPHIPPHRAALCTVWCCRFRHCRWGRQRTAPLWWLDWAGEHSPARRTTEKDACCCRGSSVHRTRAVPVHIAADNVPSVDRQTSAVCLRTQHF